MKKLAFLALILCVAGQASAAGLVAYYDFEGDSTGTTGTVVLNKAAGAAQANATVANNGTLTGGATIGINASLDATLSIGWTQIGSPTSGGHGVQVLDSAELTSSTYFSMAAQHISAGTSWHWSRQWGQIINKAGEYYMEIDGSGTGGTGIHSNVGGTTTPSYARVGWVWDSVVVSYDGANLMTYLNGGLISTTPAAAGLAADTAADLLIGYTGAAVQFEGWIDEVAIWKDSYITAAGAAALSHPIAPKTHLQLTELAGEIYIPEPATICLLGLGGLALIRRKRA